MKSTALLASENIRPLRLDSAEVLLETANTVFFYLGPISYPTPTAGFLSLPRSRTILKGRPLFFERHELPFPEHRRDLRLSLDSLYDQPVELSRFWSALPANAAILPAKASFLNPLMANRCFIGLSS